MIDQHGTEENIELHPRHVWFVEDEPDDCDGTTTKSNNGILSTKGIERIAHHKYVPGKYTVLDTFLDSIWIKLTNLLPMYIAPNLVTFIGGCHCLFGYCLTWWYTTNFHEIDTIPSWIYIVNGYCMTMYYTFDCMDGKQARRTNSSTPLGQLFDHGIDCICLHQHLSSILSFILVHPPLWILITQGTLQVTFFVAQWEEYYTGILPHSTGNIGVTEVNYGIALWLFFNGFVLRDCKTFYNQPITMIPNIKINNNNNTTDNNYNLFAFMGITDVVQFPLNKVLLFAWYCFSFVLIVLSISRVMMHINHNHKNKNKNNKNSSNYPQHNSNMLLLRYQSSALSKLISPMIVSFIEPILLIMVSNENNNNNNNRIINAVTNEIRWISLSIGMCMTLLTIKIIVYSMAKQSYASIQLVDVCIITIPFVSIYYDSRWKPKGIHILFQIITIITTIRLLSWTTIVSRQICKRLDINVFTIKTTKGKHY